MQTCILSLTHVALDAGVGQFDKYNNADCSSFYHNAQLEQSLFLNVKMMPH